MNVVMNSGILLQLLCVSVLMHTSTFSLPSQRSTNNPQSIPQGGDFVPPSDSKEREALSSPTEYQLSDPTSVVRKDLPPLISAIVGSEVLAEEQLELEANPGHEPTPTFLESEPEPQAETWPEPGPLWSEALKTWKSAWSIHVYLFATLYLLMAIYSGYFVAINIYDGLNNKYLTFSLNVMVLLFCLSRSFVMYLDPYHHGGIIHALKVMRLLWSIGAPSLTAADSLIILELLRMSHLRITLPSFQKAPVIFAIVSLHFLFVIVTDFVVAEYVSAKGMILFCQVFYMIWGFVLGTAYFRLGYMLDKQLFGKRKKDKQDKIYSFLIYASGFANCCLVIIVLYTAVGVFGVYSNVKFVNAWHWYILQSTFRFSEVIACILILTVSAKRTRIKQAMDDISAIGIGEQCSDIPSTGTPTPITTEPRPKAPQARKMSMFTDMETTNKYVIKIKRDTEKSTFY